MQTTKSAVRRPNSDRRIWNADIGEQMDFREIIPFLESNHLGVINTKRSNGVIHSSVVACGAYCEQVGFVSVYPKSQKVRNLFRDPVCTLVAISRENLSYVVIEGAAVLFDYRNTEKEKMRILLREVYSVCSETPHPDWEEYDSAMVDQDATVVLIQPTKIYGMLT